MPNIKPEEILSSVNSAPLMQRDVTASSFHGNKIQWKLNVTDIIKISGNEVRLFMHPYNKSGNKAIIPSVWANADVEKYPRLKSLHEDEVVYVIGEIERVDSGGHAIQLKSVTVGFDGFPGENNESSGFIVDVSGDFNNEGIMANQVESSTGKIVNLSDSVTKKLIITIVGGFISAIILSLLGIG